MMSFLLFLIVFVISYNNGTARPMIDSDFNIIARNGMEGYVDDQLRYKMPTIIRVGTSIFINGTLDTTSNMFKVALIDRESGDEACNIKLDFATKDLIVTPGIEDYDTAHYDFNHKNGAESTFLLRLIARLNNVGQEILGLHFQVNQEGESDQLICNINFENVGYIEMQNGVARVDSLDFQFKENH